MNNTHAMVLASNPLRGIESVQDGFDFDPVHALIEEGGTHSAWMVGGPLDMCVVDEKGHRIGDFTRNPKDDATRLANARRAAACVNALAGIPTKWLEQFIRGEFLAALRYFGHAIADTGFTYVDGGENHAISLDDVAGVRRLLQMSQKLPVPEDVL